MRVFIYLILFILPLFSCKKENSKKWTEVTITAKNHVTNESISDINCGVLTVDNGFLFSDKTIILDEKQMENGTYHFGFKAKKNQVYWAESTFDILKYHAVAFSNHLNISNNQQNDFLFELVPYGYLKLNIQNQGCVNADDKLVFRRENLSVFNDKTDWSTDRMGCYSYLSPAYFAVPIGIHKYTWKVTKNAVTNEYSDELLVNEGDSLIFNLFY